MRCAGGYPSAKFGSGASLREVPRRFREGSEEGYPSAKFGSGASLRTRPAGSSAAMRSAVSLARVSVPKCYNNAPSHDTGHGTGAHWH